jgi:hypothetical protein
VVELRRMMTRFLLFHQTQDTTVPRGRDMLSELFWSETEVKRVTKSGSSFIDLRDLNELAALFTSAATPKYEVLGTGIRQVPRPTQNPSASDACRRVRRVRCPLARETSQDELYVACAVSVKPCDLSTKEATGHSEMLPRMPSTTLPISLERPD